MNEVEAIKDKNKISAIRSVLPEFGEIYSDIFDFGLNTALRIGDLVSIKFESIDFERYELLITEQKTNKKRTITLNDTAMAVINKRQRLNHEWLFQSESNRSKGKPIRPQSVARIFKIVGSLKHINTKLGTHSMRKTRGYMMHSQGVPIEQITRMLNHSTPAVTMRYIGLTNEVVSQGYRDLVI